MSSNPSSEWIRLGCQESMNEILQTLEKISDGSRVSYLPYGIQFSKRESNTSLLYLWFQQHRSERYISAGIIRFETRQRYRFVLDYV